MKKNQKKNQKDYSNLKIKTILNTNNQIKSRNFIQKKIIYL